MPGATCSRYKAPVFEFAAKFAFYSGISMLGLVIVVNFIAVITSR